VYLGLGLRLGSGTFAGYDADAAAYFDRAGVTDATAKQQINAFVVGIKGLGLWNSMVCWPLRSSQNKGSGTTAYSLGGLGTYNGTLTNGPTWGSAGIVFDGTNDYISISNFTTSYLGTLFYCGNHSVMSSTQKGMYFKGIEIGLSETAFYGIEAVALASPFPLVGRSSTISGLNSGIQYTATGVFNTSGNTMARFYNGSSKVSASVTYPTSGALETNIGNRYLSSPAYFNGTISAATYFNSALSDSNVSSLHSLYKTTLGTGLGLP